MGDVAAYVACKNCYGTGVKAVRPNWSANWIRGLEAACIVCRGKGIVTMEAEVNKADDIVPIEDAVRYLKILIEADVSALDDDIFDDVEFEWLEWLVAGFSFLDYSGVPTQLRIAWESEIRDAYTSMREIISIEENVIEVKRKTAFVLKRIKK